MLILLKSDINAPIGQKVVHCILFFVNKGIIIVIPIKTATKMIAFISVVYDVIASYSVTALNGQSHQQKVGDNAIADQSTTIKSMAKDAHLNTLFTFLITGLRKILEAPSSQPPNGQIQLQKARPIVIHITKTIIITNAIVLILPGYIIVLVRTAGIINIGTTKWHIGTLHASIISLLIKFDPRVSNNLTTRVKEKNNANTIKPVARYLSVLPVYKII